MLGEKGLQASLSFQGVINLPFEEVGRRYSARAYLFMMNVLCSQWKDPGLAFHP